MANIRKVRNNKEMFDALTKIRPGTFCTIGYIISTFDNKWDYENHPNITNSVKKPYLDKKGKQTYRTYKYPNYGKLGAEIGYEGELGGILCLCEYNMRFYSKKNIKNQYADYKKQKDDIYSRFGVKPRATSGQGKYDQDMDDYGISVYAGGNDALMSHSYIDTNMAMSKKKTKYYAIDNNGNVSREMPYDMIKNYLLRKNWAPTYISQLVSAHRTEQEIDDYTRQMRKLEDAFQMRKLELAHVLYVVTTVNGTPTIFVNDSVVHEIEGLGRVNASDLMRIATDAKRDMIDINTSYEDQLGGYGYPKNESLRRRKHTIRLTESEFRNFIGEIAKNVVRRYRI